MLKLLKLFVVVLAAAALALVVTPVANAQERTTFVTELSPENELPPPGCPQGEESGAGGVAVVQIDEATGEISYRVVAFKLPGTVRPQGLGGHIHIGDATVAGPVVLPLELTGLSTGLVAAGTTTDPALATAILADPDNYYVNIHTDVCPAGAIRGQLG
jgi:CHRD domain